MSGYFKKKTFIVEFKAIDPDGQNSTADCVVEAYSSYQAESSVIVCMKKCGFSRFSDIQTRIANEEDMRRALSSLKEDLSTIQPNEDIH
ncbi:hypothetical protein [Enterobacter sp. PTB]|uniref:hypothetical protein n=1 Tax=Enterobacter sp. PTB TaxID=3143437 RepID=UPI003DA7C198